jgi:hypothetical protein
MSSNLTLPVLGLTPEYSVHENSLNYILQVPDTHRTDLSNKSEFIPKGLFYIEKRPSLNISHASNLRPYSSNTDRPTVGPTQSPVQWVPGALSPGIE